MERGQKIATVGSTGRTTGPHLHYELMINGEKVDPLDYLGKQPGERESGTQEP